ncbi:MAG TPA: hypothetical protein PLK72_00445 [Candidatus Woesebacteria bacterium]|nr:hypothetical protein [Candidatus Woesebacteria bacterium]
MTKEETVDHNPVSHPDLGDSREGSDNSENGDYDDDGHGNDGYANNDHKVSSEQNKTATIAENPYSIPPIFNKYKNMSLDTFFKILDAKSKKPQEIDDDLDVVLTFLRDLENSIKIAQQLTDAHGNPCFPALYEQHCSRAEYLSKLLEQFRWFTELKKNPHFDISTIGHNGYNNSKKDNNKTVF